MGNSRTGVFASGARMMLGISGTWRYLRRRVGGDAIDAPEHTHILSLSLSEGFVLLSIRAVNQTDRPTDRQTDRRDIVRSWRFPRTRSAREWDPLSRVVRLTYTLDGTVQRSAAHSLKMPCLHSSPERSSFLIPHSSFFILHSSSTAPTTFFCGPSGSIHHMKSGSRSKPF
jgi:hypothetical protein